MPLRNGKPLIWRPKGLTDALDGTNSFPGAMASLSNLIPDPSTEAIWVARPPSVMATTFPGLSSPGFVSGLLVIGNLAYGMIASALNPGQDEPFVYDIAGNTFQTITGVTSANTPASPPTTGSWTPPIIFQAGSRIIVTHPGFPGGTIKFGWFDISGFATTIVGDTVSGSAVITGNPNVLGIQPGLAITGPGIPGSSTVELSAQAFTAISVTGDSHSNFTIDSISPNTNAMRTGFKIVGPGIPPGTTITSIPSSSSITISANAASTVTTGTFYVIGPPSSYNGYWHGTVTAGSNVITTSDTTGIWAGQLISDPLNGSIPPSTVVSVVANTSVTISQNAITTNTTGDLILSGAIVIMSANATASADQITAAIEGGALGFPQWGAGDTQPNNLPSVPLGGAQMNGRAYFACGIDGIPFSDSGFPCQISDLTRTQALTTNDGLPVTAIGALTLASLLGGQVQSLVAFESIYKMQQITGDIDNGNLAMNALPVATGTNAPLSICNTEIGIAFVSPEGMRLIDFTGRVSPPTGDHGQGITVPFIYAVVPSRMCAAATAKTIRVSVENGAKVGNPLEEYWYDMARKVFHGPHTSVASLIQPWNDEFLMTFSGTTATLWVSPAVPQAPGGSWIENGNQLVWQYEPVYLMPDNGDMAMNSVIEMTLACGGPDCDPTAAPEDILYTPPMIGSPPVQPGPTMPGTPLPPNQPPPPPTQPPNVPPPVWTHYEAFAVSHDGSIAVGTNGTSSGFVGAAWWDTNTFVQTLLEQTGFAYACSADASLIFGGDLAQYWTKSTGLSTQLVRYRDDFASKVQGCSSDGSIAVGWAYDLSNNIQPIWWDVGGNAKTAMSMLAGGTNALCYACSDDGSIVVGQSQNGAEYQPCWWDRLSGVPTALNFVGGGHDNNQGNSATSCSQDGLVIGGVAIKGGVNLPVWWDKMTGTVTQLSLLAGGYTQGFVTGTASDASLFVGFSQTGTLFSAGPPVPTRWDKVTGVATQLASPPIVGSTPTVGIPSLANGISFDNSTIVGRASFAGSNLNLYAVWWYYP